MDSLIWRLLFRKIRGGGGGSNPDPSDPVVPPDAPEGSVAMVTSGGENSFYDTAVAALKAAQDGDVITLLQDCDITENVTVNRRIQIVGRGHTLGSGDGFRFIYVKGTEEAPAGLDLKRVTMAAHIQMENAYTALTHSDDRVTLQNQVNFEYNGLVLDGTDSNIINSFYWVDFRQCTIRNGTFRGLVTIRGTSTVTGGEFIGGVKATSGTTFLYGGDFGERGTADEKGTLSLTSSGNGKFQLLGGRYGSDDTKYNNNRYYERTIPGYAYYELYDGGDGWYYIQVREVPSDGASTTTKRYRWGTAEPGQNVWKSTIEHMWRTDYGDNGAYTITETLYAFDENNTVTGSTVTVTAYDGEGNVTSGPTVTHYDAEGNEIT